MEKNKRKYPPYSVLMSVYSKETVDNLEKSISSEIERLIEDRVYFFTKDKSDRTIPITIYDDNTKYNSQIVYPIIADGDTVGSIALLSTENKNKIGETELKLTQSVAMLLGKQMEN